MQIPLSFAVFVRSRRLLTALVLAPVCLAGLGCAGPRSSGWADFETQRSVEKAAADDSFPSAAEVGLATDDTPGDDS